MKWKTILPHYLRVVHRFAYFPVDLDEGYTVWLEKYYSVERKECDYDGCWWRNVHKTQTEDEATRILKCLNP